MIEMFQQFMRDEVGDTKTSKGYIKDVEIFIKFLEQEDIKVANVKETQIKQYNLWLHEKGYSNHSIARKNSSLRKFFKFLRKRGIMIHNPMDEIKQPFLKKKEFRIEKETEEKLKLAFQRNKRDWLLYCFVYIEKLKPSEIVGMKKTDYREGVLYTRTKAVRLTETTQLGIDDMLLEDGDYFFMNQRGKPMAESGMYFVIKGHLQSIGEGELRPIDLCRS